MKIRPVIEFYLFRSDEYFPTFDGEKAVGFFILRWLLGGVYWRAGVKQYLIVVFNCGFGIEICGL